MNESFRMRIGSCSERLSADLAFAILPHLQRVSGQELAPIQITLEQYRNDCHFSDVRSWNWPSSIENLRKLAGKGSNLLLLSQHFLDWDTPAEVINDDLGRFEDELAAESISVISIEAYFENQQAEMCAKFGDVQRWHEATVKHILTEMLDGFMTETLCCPYGVLPYILLDPETTDMRQNDRKHFRALVGFQPWQYEKVLKRWPTPEFPLKHEISKLKWKPVPGTGAVPMNVMFDE